MSKTPPVHELVLTFLNKEQRTLEYPSLEAAQAAYVKMVGNPALWNIAIYNMRGDCLLDAVSERNRVEQHAPKMGDDRGGLKAL